MYKHLFRKYFLGYMLRLVLLLPALGAMPAATAADAPPPDAIRAAVAAALPDAIMLYREFLALPNDARNPADIERLVAWMEPAFAARGFETRRIEMAGSPSLYAARPVEGATRTVLVYLQADGQPVDRAAWDQADPYLAVLKERGIDGNWQEIPWERMDLGTDPDWRVYARSAADSKGPMTQFLVAVELLAALDALPDYNLKVLVDTEEELGSPHLAAAVEAHRELLAADMLLIFDGPPHASNRPTVSFGARGIATATLTTYGPRVAQHSGHYGNFLPNPGSRLAELLASMKSADGRVTIDGFYDGIELDENTLAVLAQVPDDEAGILADAGFAAPDAVGASLQEALQYPSLNVRGLSSGWVGSEARTIIPPTAVAELDIRLVVESDAEHLLDLVRRHIEGQGYYLSNGEPAAAERAAHAKIASFDATVSYGAFRSNFDAPPGLMARAGMRHLFGEEPVLIRSMGGSVPIAPIVNALGIPAAIVPTVNIDNNQHSPNENLRLGNFIDGIAILVSVLAQPAAEVEDESEPGPEADPAAAGASQPGPATPPTDAAESGDDAT